MGLIRGALWTYYVQCDHCPHRTELCFGPSGKGARTYAVSLGYSEGMDGSWTCPDCKKLKSSTAQPLVSSAPGPSPAEKEMIRLYYQDEHPNIS